MLQHLAVMGTAGICDQAIGYCTILYVFGKKKVRHHIFKFNLEGGKAKVKGKSEFLEWAHDRSYLP